MCVLNASYTLDSGIKSNYESIQIYLYPNKSSYKINKLPISDYEKKIFKKELDRSVEIARIAINNTEALNALYSVSQ